MKIKDQIPILHRQTTIGVFLSILLGIICGILITDLIFLFLVIGILIVIYTLTSFSPGSIGVLTLFLIAGILRGQLYMSTITHNENHIEHIINARLSSITLVAQDRSTTHNGRSTFTGTIQDTSISLKVLLPEEQFILPGDVLEVMGNIKVPEVMEDSFNYKAFLQKDGVYGELRAQNVHILDTVWHPLRALSFINFASQERIYSLWEEDKGALIAGILIGARQEMSESLVDDFRKTGLAHIVAISGGNITIIIIFIFSILSFLPRWIQILSASFIIILFILFVGASSAVVRAGVMGVLGLFALLAERRSIAWYSLLLSVLAMGVYNPYTLLYDIGFQLSVCAVVGLLFAQKLLLPLVQWLPKLFGIQENMLVTLSAMLFTTPIQLLYFQSFSFIAPIANILIPPLLPYVMLSSFITFMLSLLPFTDFVRIPLQIITDLVVGSILWLTHLLGQLPYAYMELPPFLTVPVCLISYAALSLVIWYTYKN